MRVDNNLPLSSILVFKKKIQTPHSLLNFILGWQSSSLRKFKPLPTSASRLAITPEDYSRRQLKDLTAKSMAKLFWPRSGTALAGLTKHRVFLSQQQSLLASTGSLEENVLPLLRY